MRTGVAVALLSLVVLALMVAGVEWLQGRQERRRAQVLGPTVAQIAATPVRAVITGRFTCEAVCNDIEAEEHAFARRLRDELRPDVIALDAIMARLKAGLEEITV